MICVRVATVPMALKTSVPILPLLEMDQNQPIKRAAYLRYLFSKIPSAQNEADFLDLLPNRIDKAVIGAADTGAV
jgi:hypothetical protein